MAKDDGKKKSANEIIENLAAEMGVDEQAKPPKSAPPPIPKAVSAEKEAVSAEKEAVSAEKEAVSAEQKTAPEPAPPEDTETTAVTATPSLRGPEAVAAAEARMAKGGLSALLGDSEGDAYVDGYYDSQTDYADDIPLSGSGWILRLAIVILVTFVGLGGTYLAIPEEKRSDVWDLLKGVDIQEQRRTRRAAEEDCNRRIMLAERPLYGDLAVFTRPGYGLISLDNAQNGLFQTNPNDAEQLVETRSGTAFRNLSVTEHHVINVSLPNYQERRIELLPLLPPPVPEWNGDTYVCTTARVGQQTETLWQQNQDTGAYFAEFNEILDPVPLVALELILRMTPSAEVPDLIGTITVGSEPQGAQVFYNGRLLVGEDGAPLLTPVSFNSYPPPPPVEGVEPIEGSELPLPISLSVRGVPIRVELEGYMPLVTGVYRHMYTCNVVEGAREEQPFWEQCAYTYNTGVFPLMTPEEFSPPEPEGSGQGVEETDTPTSLAPPG
jgi:hypothetical protein